MSTLDLNDKDVHAQFAANLFNETWSLLDNDDRTDEETFLMIHTAHASRYHWTKVGGPLELARGEWLISRVYAVLGMGDQALLHGQYSLDLCLDNSIKDFDLAFAYEAVARAAVLLEDEELYEGYYRMASDAAKDIEKPDDKSYFLDELKSIKK